MAKYEEDLIQFDVPLLFRDVKLPSFWSDKPASWFALVESRFRTHSITGEQAKFHQLVRALSKESIGRVLDLIEVPPLFTPYSLLKARLLEAHQLTDYQKVDQLLKMESLGARRPSELLAAACWKLAHAVRRRTSSSYTCSSAASLPSSASCWVKTTTKMSATW